MAERLSPISAKGDLIAGNASGYADKLSVGSDGQVLMANSTAAMGMVWSTVAAGTGSVTSQEMSVAIAVETSNRVSADNALSNLISVLSATLSTTASALSQQISVLSVVVSNTVSAVVANSADVTSLKNRVSANSAVVSNALSAIAANSAQMTSADNAISNAVSVLSIVVSNAISAITTNSADVTSLKNRVSANSAILSDHTSAIQANSADATSLKNVVSNLSVQLSLQVSAISTQLSLLKFPPVESVTSADYTLSAGDNGKIKYFTNSTSAIFVNIPTGLPVGFEAVLFRASGSTSLTISAQTSVTFEAQGTVLPDPKTAAQVIHKLSDNYIGIGAFLAVSGGNVSVTSAEYLSALNRLSGLSSDFTSFKASLNNFTDVSIASPTDGQRLVYNSAAGQWVNSTTAGGAGSVTSANHVSLASAVSALQFPAIETNTSATYSVVEADRGKIKYFTTATSIEVILPDGLTSGFQALIFRAQGAGQIRFSATTSVEAAALFIGQEKTGATIIHRGSNNWTAAGALGSAIAMSVTSTEYTSALDRLSALSTQVTSADNAISAAQAATSAAQAATSAAVQTISLGLGGVQMGVMTTGVVSTSAALAKISGLSISLAANGLYQIQGAIIASGASTIGFAVSTSGATYTHAALRWIAQLSTANTFGASALSGTNTQIGQFDNAGFGSITLSGLAGTGVRLTTLDGIIVVSTTGGTIQIKAKGGATNAVNNIMKGSYIRAHRIG